MFYEGCMSEILYTTKFDDNSDLGKTHLGRIDMIRSHKIKTWLYNKKVSK